MAHDHFIEQGGSIAQGTIDGIPDRMLDKMMMARWMVARIGWMEGKTVGQTGKESMGE